MTGGTLSAKLYDRRGDFDFRVVGFHYICSNVPESQDCGVFVSQLVICTRGFVVEAVINSRLSCFCVCDLVLCWSVLHASDLTSPDMTGYSLDSTAGSWPEQVKFPGIFLHAWVFPSVRVVLSVTFNPVFVIIMY